RAADRCELRSRHRGARDPGVHRCEFARPRGRAVPGATRGWTRGRARADPSRSVSVGAAQGRRGAAMNARAIALVIVGCARGVRAGSVTAAGALTPYRELAHSSDAARVLARTRGEIARSFGTTADTAVASDSTGLDWPGAPCGVYL